GSRLSANDNNSRGRRSPKASRTQQKGSRDLSNHAPPGAVGCKKRMECFCTSASSAAGLVLTVMASACARASWAAGIAASIGRKDMNHEFINKPPQQLATSRQRPGPSRPSAKQLSNKLKGI